MKKTILILMLVFGLLGCDGMITTKNRYSELKEETAEIIAMNYVPSRSDTQLNPGMTMNGDFVISLSSTSFPEVYAVTLRCSDHNKTFAFDNEEIFNKVKIGETIILRYVDVIQESYIYQKGKLIMVRNSTIIIDQHTKQIIIDKNIINK